MLLHHDQIADHYYADQNDADQNHADQNDADQYYASTCLGTAALRDILHPMPPECSSMICLNTVTLRCSTPIRT